MLFYVHIHGIFFIFMYLYSHPCYIFHIHVFIFIFMLFSYSWLCYAWFCSFIFMVYFHGTRESGCITSHSYSAHQKTFCVLTVPDNASTISHNFALSNQRMSWRSGMSFALHQESHRFGPPSAHIFIFVIFSVVRFSLVLCVSTLTKEAIKRTLPAKLWPRGDKNLG